MRGKQKWWKETQHLKNIGYSIHQIPCFFNKSMEWKIIRGNYYKIIRVRVKKNRRRQWHPTPVLLPGKSHGWRSQVGCSPWDRWESDTTERLHFHFSLSCIGEGNGNPLQYSCLENPRDGGAWWAAIYGVTQSRTRLKQLSSNDQIQCIDFIWILIQTNWL